MKQKQALEKKSNDYTKLWGKYYNNSHVDLFDPFAIPPIIHSSKKLTVSVVIPAGNVESSILSCLTSIEQSSFNKLYGDRLQVVVVSDGSTDSTWEILNNSNLSLNLTVAKQNHHGQAQALNTGISLAANDIIICCDADMVLSYYTIEHFVAIHQQLPNVLLAGFRSDTPSSNPRVNAKYIGRNGTHKYSEFYFDERIIFPIPGCPSNMCLISEHYKNLGFRRGLWMRGEDPWLLPDLVFGVLFSLPRNTYYKIGGYDERLIGWGCTDGYLASKAIAVGNYVIPVYAASGLHISHSNRSKSKLLEYKRNRRLFKKLIAETDINKFPDWLEKAKERILESYNYLSKNKVETLGEINQIQKIPKFLKIDSLLSIGKYSDVIKLIDPKDKDKQLLLRLGDSLLGAKRYAEAADIFSTIIDDFAEVAIRLALTYAASGKFNDANLVMSNFANENPESSFLPFWYKLSSETRIEQGLNYFNQEFYEVALRCFETVLIIEPNNKMALKYRNKILHNYFQFLGVKSPDNSSFV